jgi:hypothetical protein
LQVNMFSWFLVCYRGRRRAGPQALRLNKP